jgi:hypothetical protein
VILFKPTPLVLETKNNKMSEIKDNQQLEGGNQKQPTKVVDIK